MHRCEAQSHPFSGTGTLRATCRKVTGGVAVALIAAVVISAWPAAALAQPRQPYRPQRDRQDEPRQQERREQRDEGRELFRQGRRAGEESEAGNTWSIVLMAFRDDEQQRQGRQALAMVQGEWGLRDAYLERRGQATVVAYGRYPDPSDARAQADLKRIRELRVEIDGRQQRPFELSFFAPPVGVEGTIPEYDLRNAQKIHGRSAIYTLQIGMYRREDGKTASAREMAEFRKLAEDAVVQLRREGEQAFYYHGPTGSTVTIGLFGPDDFDPQDRLESPQLRQLRQRYPHNLLNGMGIRRTMRMTDQQGRQVRTERLDPSMLVAVPREQ